jgi:hypothetical protein
MLKMQASRKNLSGNKRAGIGVSLTELMDAVLAVGMILILIYIGVKLSAIFASDKGFDSTIASFDVLGERIEQLVNDKNYANTNMLYYLKKGDYILVGFNYKDTYEMKTCDNEPLKETREMIKGMCGKACLCLYTDTALKDFDENRNGPQAPVKCKSFDKNIVFLAPYEQEDFCSTENGWHPSVYEDYYSTERYKFLILKGFDTKEIYLDKYEADGNVFIFLAKYSDDEKIKQRKEFMKNKYGNGVAPS